MDTLTDRIGIQPASAAREEARSRRACFAVSLALNLYVGVVALVSILLPACVVAAEKTVTLQSANGASTLSAPNGAPDQSASEAQTATVGSQHRADFGRQRASPEARQLADWIVHSADSQDLPFVIIDKVDAKIFVFDAGGRIRGAAPALLGIARGDHTVPGIGDREYSDMPPSERTTPAGRFVAALGRNVRGEDVVWVDYDAGVSLHRVVTNKPEERRLQRLATPTPRDNRISYGCINVPAQFYESVIRPAFSASNGIVYVLPETSAAREVFSSYDVAERLGRDFASRADAPK